MRRLIFTIGEVAHLAGVTPKTIRHYHEIGLLPEAARAENNYRLYSLEQLERLQQIQAFKRLGLSLHQIKQVFESDQPEMLVQQILRKQQQHIQSQIYSLQQQLTDIEAYLQAAPPVRATPAPPATHSAMQIIASSIKPRASGLADILTLVEDGALDKLDRYEWADGYALFWHEMGQTLLQTLARDESQFIFWMERYIALGQMPPDDLQGRAWIEQIGHSRERLLIARVFSPPPSDALPEIEQQQIQKMMPLMLYQEASELQRAFLRALMRL